jgi:primosomal protein N' (replication factor Y)
MYAQVILPLSRFKSFTYRVPDRLSESIRPGTFVTVPFRKTRRTGVVSEIRDTSPFTGPLKSILGPAGEPFSLPAELWHTLEWMSRYYLTPLGMVLKGALPLGFSQDVGIRRQTFVSITPAGRDALKSWPDRAPAQKAVLELLASQELPVTVASLATVSAAPHALCRRLESRNLVRMESAELIADPFHKMPVPIPKEVTLNAEQSEALAAILAAVDRRRFATFLLRGVTGSGKTEVYLHAAREILARGGAVLVLVPEIALTPQVATRFRAVFGLKVALWHSRLSRTERAWTWQQMLRGRFSIVVGPRSALFAPLPDLQLIIVDEEQEGTYKQEDPAPRYHARDVALVRGKYAQAAVLLISATPCVESYYNGLMERYSRLRLKKRFGGARYPQARLVDLVDERRQTGDYQLVLSRVLVDAIEARLDRREQVILLQNRRGFAPVIRCHDCGYTAMCPHCAVLLTYHKGEGLLKCHYCGYACKGPETCPRCGGMHIYVHGAGTEKVEELLRRLFPNGRVRRMDTDTTRSPGAHYRILQDFDRGNIDILLGTQMIAKGLDFENVTLVGVVNADTGLFLPDFRAGERTFQLVYQVCGRAGRRSDKPGEAIIQTFNPEDIAVRAAAHLDAHRFYNQVLAERRELGYPPFSRLARILLVGSDREQVWTYSQELHDRLTPVKKGMTILGPATAPFERLRGKWRVHLLLKSDREVDPNGQQLNRHIRERVPRAWLENLREGVRLRLDIDPGSLL